MQKYMYVSNGFIICGPHQRWENQIKKTEMGGAYTHVGELHARL